MPSGKGAAYYGQYISRTNTSTIAQALENGYTNVLQQLNALTPEQWNHRYAPDKWSIKELVQHLTDTERIFATRALCFARGETQALPGFDQDLYVQQSFADYKEPALLLEEYKTVRHATIAMYKGFSTDILQKTGTANETVFTVEEVGYITAGHELHHLDILKERYL